MKPILLILTALWTQCANGQISHFPSFQWRIDSSSSSDRYVWPEVSDEFLQNASFEELATRFLLQSFYGGLQVELAWHLRGVAGTRKGIQPAPLHGELTEARLRNLVQRMTEEARSDPWMVSEFVLLLRRIGPVLHEIPFYDEHLTLAMYEGLIDLPGTTIFEYMESPLSVLISRTPRSELWLARIQADIEAEEQTNGETDRLRFLQMLKADLGGRSWEEKLFCD